MESRINHILRTIYFRGRFNIFDVIRELVPFMQFKKCEKHPWRKVSFSKVLPNRAKRLIQRYRIAEILNYSKQR